MGMKDSVPKQELINLCYIRKAFPLKIRLKENPNPASVRLPSTGVIFQSELSVTWGTC